MASRGVVLALCSALAVHSATAGPLVYNLRQPVPDLAKHRGFFTCSAALNEAVGNDLILIEPRHQVSFLEHTRYYGIKALVKSREGRARIHAGCTTTKDGRAILSTVIGLAATHQ
ncbi:MAG: hypothetical protein HC809_16225 [Gammaproteobacteria bacterium]|nr:hypothetical protein [Gammaproteobacteria bacterium]